MSVSGRKKKGVFRKYINIIIVFGVSGLWHGASWHFVIWGIIHALFQIAGDLKQRMEKRFLQNKVLEESFSGNLRKALVTFVLVDFAWVFFAADSIHMAFGIFKQMFTTMATTSVFELGLDRDNWKIMIMSIVLLLAVDLIHEKGISIKKVLSKQEIWFTLFFYNVFIWMVIMLGIYGVGYDTSQFIYFQF